MADWRQNWIVLYMGNVWDGSWKWEREWRAWTGTGLYRWIIALVSEKGECIILYVGMLRFWHLDWLLGSMAVSLSNGDVIVSLDVVDIPSVPSPCPTGIPSANWVANHSAPALGLALGLALAQRWWRQKQTRRLDRLVKLINDEKTWTNMARDYIMRFVIPIKRREVSWRQEPFDTLWVYHIYALTRSPVNPWCVS